MRLSCHTVSPKPAGKNAENLRFDKSKLPTARYYRLSRPPVSPMMLQVSDPLPGKQTNAGITSLHPLSQSRCTANHPQAKL